MAAFGIPISLLNIFILSYFSLLLKRSVISSMIFSGVKSICCNKYPPPLLANSIAFQYWWLSAACGYGINIAGIPIAVISAIVVAPALQIITSAILKAAPISSKKLQTNALISVCLYASFAASYPYSPVQWIICSSFDNGSNLGKHLSITSLIACAPWLPPVTNIVFLEELSPNFSAERLLWLYKISLRMGVPVIRTTFVLLNHLRDPRQ